MMRFYAPFITEATLQVTMALRSEMTMVGRRQKYRGPAEAKIARRNASWTRGVIHERALSPAEFFGGKTPAGA